MKAFVNGVLVIIAALGGTWSILDKHIMTALIYYIAGFWFYIKLEQDILKNNR